MSLNAIGSNTAGNGTDVNLWPCDEVWETWSYDEATGHIRAGWDENLCLDVAGTDSDTAGTNVQTWPCDEVTEAWSIEYAF